MKLHCDYDTLVRDLSDVSEVVEDRLASEDLRNIIFSLKDDDMRFIGVNQVVTFKRKMAGESYSVDDLPEGGILFQLNSKELIGFLSSYNGVRKTKVEEVSFEEGKKEHTILCKVLERNTDTNEPTVSTWCFNSINIKQTVMPSIERKCSDDIELENTDTKSLLFYTRNLGKQLQAGTNLYSHLIFGEDYVVVFSTAHLSFMRNLLGDTFKGVKLSYRAVGFMDKVICNEPMVEVGRADKRYLYFKTDTSEAFILFDSTLPNYQSYVDAKSDEHGMVIDRVYFMDTLKRLKLMNEAVEFEIKADDGESGILGVKNSKFSQDLVMLNSRNMDVDKHKFKVMPEVLEKAVLGDDAEFSGELFVYYCVQQNKQVMLVFRDNSDSWFSVMNVKPY